MYNLRKPVQNVNFTFELRRRSFSHIYHTFWLRVYIRLTNHTQKLCRPCVLPLYCSCTFTQLTHELISTEAINKKLTFHIHEMLLAMHGSVIISYKVEEVLSSSNFLQVGRCHLSKQWLNSVCHQLPHKFIIY